MPALILPDNSGVPRTFTLSRPKGYPQKAEGAFNRVAYSAAHVVADPLSPVDPWITAAIDWDTTIAYRKRLWGLGLGVAEAMDTAQRGMGLDWPTSLELIRRSLDAAKDHPGALVASGCGTDQINEVRRAQSTNATYGCSSNSRPQNRTNSPLFSLSACFRNCG